ncbi:MAG TPA: T9SS type A sorting domain-containing protein, partial [Chitinivibrionales bacterium]
MPLTLSRAADHKSLTFTCAANGNFDVRIFKRDTITLDSLPYAGSSSYLKDSLISRQTGTYANGHFTVAIRDSSVRVVAYVWNATAEGRMDSSFFAAATPVIARSNQKALPLSCTLENGMLVIRGEMMRGIAVRLCALSLNGKVVIDKTITMNKAEQTIDPKRMGLAAGCYFLRLATVRGVFTQRILVPR